MAVKAPIRLIDAGRVSYLRSQTIYHALAYAKKPESPDTIVLATPAEPYVCIGFHQDIEKEVNLGFCRAAKIPVLRRETGGGTVYIDENQLFVQWIFEPGQLPWKVDRRFRLFIQPLVETYQFFGINAYFYPPNDAQVRGKKITGTGAAAIGQAEVLTGNFLLDFDCETMANTLNVPDDPFRQTIAESLRQYLTSMKQELGSVPELQAIKDAYVKRCEESLQRDIEPGSLSDEELEWMEKLDEKFAAKEWLYQFNNKKHRQRLVKIHAGVWVGEASRKTNGGLIRATIRTKKNRIDDISISGTFDFQPASKLSGFEKVLRHVALTRESLRETIEASYQLHAYKTPGITIEDWVETILSVKSKLADAGVEQ